MKTKLDYYKIFYETANCSSFSTAAKKLYISQSAISQCMHQLEEDLNTQLFLRTKRGISLTKEGKLLYQKIETAIQAIEQGETLLARLQHLESGSLTIAAGDTVTARFLLPYLEQFHATYPNIRIEMANSYTNQMLQMVKEGKAELAFVNMPVQDEELCIQPCLTIHDIFVCNPEQQLKPQYTWKEIAKEPLILLEENSNSRHYVNQQFRSKNIELIPQIEIAAHDLLLQFASIRLGVSCVIEEFAREELNQGKIQKINLQPPLPSRNIGYAYLKNTPLSQSAKAFLELMENQ